MASPAAFAAPAIVQTSLSRSRARLLSRSHFIASYLAASPVSPPRFVPPSRTYAALSTPNVSTMKFNKLGSSDLLVSEVCLGTMTWGVQNSEAEAHEQIDYAVNCGINFLDTAEIYPVPGSAPGQQPGRTEEYIGTWLAKNPGMREKLIIATKVMGFSMNSKTVANRYVPMREPFPDSRQDAQSIFDACAASMRRLQTDYIDLYQLHWPDRYVPLFGQRTYDVRRERPDSVPLREVLLALKQLLDDGKIRAYGLSNETTFGLCEICRLADEIGMPRPATIQNSFCMLDRRFEAELAEACSPSNYNVGLLPWSILAGGFLSGKYIGKVDENGKTDDEELKKSRFVMFKGYQARFSNKTAVRATSKYAEIAQQQNMSLAVMAQAFCKSRWYIPSSIIGATSMKQLKENIEAFKVDLSEDVLQKIDKVHNEAKDCIISA